MKLPAFVFALIALAAMWVRDWPMATFYLIASWYCAWIAERR